MKELGNRLKNLREMHGLTQSAAGALIGEPVGNYQNYEYGDSNPSIEQLIIFAKEFHSSIEYITRGRENRLIYTNETISFHERLKEFRKKHNLTQQQLATILNMKPQNYQKYEYDITIPTLERIMQLADIFGVTMDDMVGRVRK